jgi:hypothetical protein
VLIVDIGHPRYAPAERALVMALSAGVAALIDDSIAPES